MGGKKKRAAVSDDSKPPADATLTQTGDSNVPPESAVPAATSAPPDAGASQDVGRVEDEPDKMSKSKKKKKRAQETAQGGLPVSIESETTAPIASEQKVEDQSKKPKPKKKVEQKPLSQKELQSSLNIESLSISGVQDTASQQAKQGAKKKGAKQDDKEPQTSSEQTMTPKPIVTLALAKPLPTGSWKIIDNDGPVPPQRPQKQSCGNVGKPIRLTTNLFEVSVKNQTLKLYHYDVVIKDHRGSETLPKKKKMIVFEKLKESYPRVFGNSPISYDSMKNAYSTELISQAQAKKDKKATTYDVECLMDEGNKNKSKFTISLTKVAEASLRDLFECIRFVQGKKKEPPTSIMQMVEVMFRHYRSLKYEQVAGRSFFSLCGEFARPLDIGGGKQGVAGFFGSMRTSAWKDGSILLNINMAHTAFYKEQPVIDFIKEHNEIRIYDFGKTIDPFTARKIEKLLKGLKIRVTHAPRTYKFNKILSQGSDKTTFNLETEKGMRKATVQEFFRTQYTINLRHPQLNCLHVGNPEKSIYIPMELCMIAKGQRVIKKLSDRETATFIRSTAIPPHDRLSQIKRVAQVNRFNEDPMLRSLTFTISDMPLQTTGRVLPPPGLKMDKNFNPFQGQWETRDKKFFNGATLNEWAVINYDGYTRMEQVKTFVSMLVRMANERGMRMQQPFDIYEFKGREPQPLKDFEHYKKMKPGLQLIMIVLPGRRFYGAIKMAGDTQSKIISQCVQGANVAKASPQTIGNIILKINAKMDGINNVVSLPNNLPLVSFAREPNARYIIMGADVNHPPVGGDTSIPSIAAVVGSYDQFATKYAVERRAQYHRVEIIQDLTTITKNLLVSFYKSTKAKPSRIIMYRDGVSESQFYEVLSSEMIAMRNACTLLQKDYQPGITFICVQKRHHTRLFCDEREGVGKSRNIPPGTIVDKDITHPTDIDFFLCSHQGIQGTSRPTHYHLLWDDNDLEINELQQLTYRLCHVYSRCSKSVSIPAPVYYAHLAAFRAKVYVGEFLDDSDAGSVASGGGDLQRKQQEIISATNITAVDDLGKRLHYI